MRKKTGKILLPFFLIFLVIATAPMMLGLDPIRSGIIKSLEEQFNRPVRIEDMEWTWLPIPCLLFADAGIESSAISISLPEMKLYPAWSSLIRGKLAFSKIIFKSPLIKYSGSRTTDNSPNLRLQELRIDIENGTLILPPIDDIFTAEELSFSHINGQLKFLPEMVSLDFQFSGPLCQTALVFGTYRPQSGSYDLLLRGAGFNLAQCLSRLTTEQITLDETGMAMQVTIKGTGQGSFKASFAGNPPSLIVDPADKGKTILMGTSQFSLAKENDKLTLTIDSLEFVRPAFTISGQVNRTDPSIADATKPTWLLDLTATKIDLSQVRKTVLDLWGKSPTAQHVCDIVRGGTAHSARYRFHEAASGFEHIENMDLEMDIERATINVPATGLLLTEGSGPIAIRNGILSGSNLRASLEKSHGFNGSIRLDLKHGGDDFQLDLDIDADLAALPPVLDRLVKNQGFRNELHRFQNVSGRASGHLRMGNTFSDLNTFVTVDRVQTTAFYDRIAPANDADDWEISIVQGQLRILPREVNWNNVSASLGEQKIFSMSGKVNWQDDIRLDIDNLNASIESTSLYDKLQKKKVTPTVIADAVSFVTGKINIIDGSFHGPPATPEQWHYNLSLTSPGLRSSSPLLPAAVFTEALSATINENTISLPETDVSFMGQTQTVTGNFHHSQLQDWNGKIHIKGGINEDISAWLKERWLPPQLTPRLPAIVSGLTIEWDKDRTEISGAIHKDTPDSLPSLSFVLASEKDYLQLKNAEIHGLDDSGRLTFDLWKKEPQHFLMTWQGRLRHQTLDSLLARTTFLSGTLNGSFNMGGTRFPRITSFNGSATLDNLQWPLGEESITAELQKFSMTGKSKQVEINEISVTVGQQSFTGSGTLTLAASGPQLDMDISSDSFSQQTISRLTARWDRAEDTAEEQTASPYEVTGRIGFSVARYFPGDKIPFPSPREETEEDPVNSMTGRIKLFPENRNAIFLNNGDFCGLSISGSWYSEPSMAEDTLTVSTREPLLFEEFLPCLNISQDIIKGSVAVNAELKGNGKLSRGRLTLDSDKGRILRMTLLSRLFRIINITDLFTALELQDYETKGFPYSRLELHGHIDGDSFIIERLVVLGEGLNIFGRGSFSLSTFNADITLLIAPLKTVDAIISNLPVIGPAITGKDKAIATIPVGIRGNLLNPTITILPPDAVGDAVLNVVKETLMLPFTILRPVLEDNTTQQRP